jgi:TonB family protein
MKLITVFSLLLCSFQSIAADWVLIPVHTPSPLFPPKLVENRHAGKVRVKLTVAAHGGIQAANIVESSHPQLTEATQHAVVKWRFKPWDHVQDGPSSIEVIVPILFGARGIEPFSKDITLGLRNALCAYLNYEIKTSLSNYADEPLKKVDVFWYAHEFLNGSYVALQVPDERRRAALVKQLEKSIPRVVKNCRRNPDHPVAYYLPKGVREVLVGL